MSIINECIKRIRFKICRYIDFDSLVSKFYELPIDEFVIQMKRHYFYNAKDDYTYFKTSNDIYDCAELCFDICKLANHRYEFFDVGDIISCIAIDERNIFVVYSVPVISNLDNIKSSKKDCEDLFIDSAGFTHYECLGYIENDGILESAGDILSKNDISSHYMFHMENMMKCNDYIPYEIHELSKRMIIDRDNEGYKYYKEVICKDNQ